jgi:P27 family predicted phage terminase small subunit
MGRPRKPTALKIVEGNPGKRKLPEDEPQLQIERPTMPRRMSPVAKEAWKRFAPLLEVMGVLTKVDSGALERLCETYAEIADYQNQIARCGSTYSTVTEHGQEVIRPHPAVAMLSAADRRFKTYLTEFGLTPAARAKVKVEGKKKKGPGDPADDYFG